MLARSVLAKRWQQATIKDNIIFNWIFGENPTLFKGLVERLFETRVGNFEALSSERSFKDHRIFYRPRFDTYGEDDLDNIINVELQNENHHDLEKRIAIYQASLTQRALLSGQSFNKRKQTLIAFLCDFDLYGRNRPVYKLKTTVEGQEDILVDRGETNVIFNLKATDLAGLPADYVALVTYFNTGRVSDEFTAAVDQEFRRIKGNDTRKEYYMSIEAILTMEKAYARQDGWDEGHVEGRAEGRTEGRDEAREETAKALIEDARQNHKDKTDLLATLKVIFKDQAYIDKMLAKYYYE
ncbi:PD-(D/E)XK nuclease family transposase [Ligilactobacillus agilis]|uniref:PD-(D/E)XK nuclease family transposase n=1 Tax=Ligilactobacillus agilis TaxID=1601 RepID=UPI000B8D3DBC|nr:PD-(D/E)XK nuclease family transposase [Ligilactobacillus agilis]ASR41135.1 hypothetical protein BEN83_06460 [Ligilactobacillus agilis]